MPRCRSDRAFINAEVRGTEETLGLALLHLNAAWLVLQHLGKLRQRQLSKPPYLRPHSFELDRSRRRSSRRTSRRLNQSRKLGRQLGVLQAQIAGPLVRGRKLCRLALRNGRVGALNTGNCRRVL